MARFDTCPNCGAAMPAGSLHCFDCGVDLPVPPPDSGSVLVQLYPARTQAEAFEFYRLEVPRLAAAGWYPVAHSWGEEPAGKTGETGVTGATGALMVTYRQEGHA